MTTIQTTPTAATRAAISHWPNYAHIGCFDPPPVMATQSNRVKKAMDKLAQRCAEQRANKPKKGQKL